MNVEYKAKITGDMSGLEKVLKAANGSMKQLTDKDFVIKLDYDGNVKALNKTLSDAVKACPELAIQFQYDVNKKALEQKLNDLKSIEALQVDIDTSKVQRKVREMISDIETGFESGIDTDDVLKAKVESLYKYANSAAKAGAEVSVSFDRFEDIDNALGGLLTKLSKTPQYFGDMSKGISGALEQTKADISEIQKQLDFFKAKGAVDMTEGFDKTEEEIDETSKKLKELVDGFEAYYKKKKGLNAGNYWKQLKKQIDDGDDSLKELLSDLKLLDDGTLNLIAAGNKNQGGIIGAERVAIARKNDNNQYEDTLALKKALDEAYDAGVNVARIMDVIGDESRETFVEIQERATGKMLGVYGQHTASGLPEVNPEYLEATDEQIQKLIQDIFTLQKLGINAEAHPENLIYDKLKGFQFIDLDLNPTSYIDSAEMIEDAAMRIAGDVEDMYDELGDAKGLKAVQNFGDKFRNIGAAMAEVYDAAEKTAEETQDSHSPSKVAEKLGEKWGVGYAEGIKKHKGDVEDAVRELVKAGELTMRDLVEDLPNIVGNAEYIDLESPVKNILSEAPKAANSAIDIVENAIKTIEKDLDDFYKDLAREDPKGLLSKYLFGKDGKLLSSDELADQINKEYQSMQKKLGDLIDSGVRGDELQKVQKSFFERILSAQASGLLSWDLSKNPKINKLAAEWYKDGEKSYSDWRREYARNNRRQYNLDQEKENLSAGDAGVYLYRIIDNEKKLASIREDNGQSYIAYLNKVKDLNEQIADVEARAEQYRNTGLSGKDTPLNAENSQPQIDDIQKIVDEIDEVIQKYKELKEAKNASLYEDDAHIMTGVPVLERLQNEISSTALEYQIAQRTWVDQQSEVFRSGVGTLDDTLFDVWSNLDDGINEAKISGEEALERFGQKAKELGYTFDEVAKNWVKINEQPRELLSSEQAFVQYGESLDEVAKKSQYTKEQLEGLYKSGRTQLEAPSAVDVLAEAYESVSKASEKASSDIGDATESIKKEGQAAEDSARQKDKFTKANQEAAKSGEETAKSAKKAADAVKGQGKVFKENSDLTKWLSEVQSGIRTVEFDVALNKEMAEAEIKKIAATLAEEFNKAYGTSVTGAQVARAYKASLEERCAAEKEQGAALKAAEKQREAVLQAEHKMRHASSAADEKLITEFATRDNSLSRLEDTLYSDIGLLEKFADRFDDVRKALNGISNTNDLKLIDQQIKDLTSDVNAEVSAMKVAAKESEKAEREREATLQYTQKVNQELAKMEKAESDKAHLKEVNDILASYKELLDATRAVNDLTKKSQKDSSAYGDALSSAQERLRAAGKEIERIQYYDKLSILDDSQLDVIDKIISKIEVAQAETEALNNAQEKAASNEAIKNSNSLYDGLEATLKEIFDLQKATLSLDSETELGKTRIADNEKAIAEKSQQALDIYQKINDASAVQEERENRLLQLSEEREVVLSRMMRDQELQSRDDMTSQVGKWITQVEALQKSGKYTQEFTQELNEALIALRSFDSATGSIDEVNASFEKLDTTMKNINSSKILSEVKRAQESSIAKLNLQIEEFMQKNSRMGSEFQQKFKNLKLDFDAETSLDEVQKLVAEFAKLKAEVTAAGKTGASFFDTLRQRVLGVNAQLIAQYLSWQDMIRYARQAIEVIKDLDYALVDLKKTTTMTSSELKDFYYSANDTAKQMGVTTEQIINQAAAWSRLGYSSQEAATEMAALSSQFAQISPGMDIDLATDGLVSTMKAFHVDVADVERNIMDVINKTGNTMATTNEEIVEMLKRSSAAMSAANNTIEETIALESAAVQITRNAETTGTAFRTISMRIRGYDEETEEYIGGIEELTGKIADLTKTAKTPGGISLFTDETKSTYKSTYQILKDISEIYNDLTDKDQAALLETLAGKRGGQVLAGILQDFSEVERAMGNMEKAAGSADDEMAIVEESITYKLNNLQQTWIGIVQQLIDSGDLGKLVDALTKISEVLGVIVTSIGPVPSIIAGFGLTRLITNLDDVSNLIDTLPSVLKLFDVNPKTVNQFADAFKGTGVASQAWRETMTNANKATKEFVHDSVLAGKGADEIASGFAKGTKSATSFGTAIKGIGKSLAAIGTTAAIVAAIVVVTKAISACVTAEKEMAEQTKKLSDSYAQTSSDIDSYKIEIEKLQETLKDSNSSYEETKSARERLMEIQDELIKKYGTEKDAIWDITNALDGEVDALDRVAAAKWQETLNSINTPASDGLFGQLGYWFNTEAQGYADQVDKALHKITDVRSTALGTSLVTENQKDVELLKEIAAAYDDINVSMLSGAYGGTDIVLYGDDMQQFYESLLKVQEQVKKYGGSDELNQFLEKTAQNAKKVNDQYGSFGDQYVLNEKILKSFDYSKSLDDVTAAVEKYKKAYSEGFANDAEKNQAISELASVYDSAIANIDDAQVIAYIEKLYPAIQSTIADWKFDLNFNTDGTKENLEDIINRFKEANGGDISYEDLRDFNENAYDASDERIAAYKDLELAAEGYDLSVTNLIEKLKEEKLVMSEGYQKLVDKYGEANIAALSPEDLAIAETYADTMFGSYDALLSKIAATKEEQKQLNDEQTKMVSWASERDAALTKLGMASESNGEVTYDESWTKYLETIKQLNPELASNQEEVEKCALANLQFSHAVDDLSKNFDSYKLALQDADALTPEFSNAINALADDLTYLTGLNFSIEDATKFLSDTNNLNLLEEAIKGSDEALQELQATAAKAIPIKIDTQSVTELKELTDATLPMIKKELESIGEGGNVNLTLRPKIDTQDLVDMGWAEAAGDEYATVFSSTVSNELGDIAVNFTPIMVDPKTGKYLGVMEKNAFYDYCQDVVDGVHDDYLNLQIGAEFTGEDAIDQAVAAAERVHNLHEFEIELGLSTDDFNAQFTDFVTWLDTADLGTLEAQTYLNENPFIQGLLHLASQSEEMANKIKQIFADLGWEIKWDTAKMKVPKPNGSNITSTYAKDAYGNPIGPSFVRWDWEYLDVPTNIRLERTGGAGSRRTPTSGYTPRSTSPSQKASSSPSGGSGGGGGGGNESDGTESAEKEFDEFYDYFDRFIKVLDQRIDLLRAHLEDVVGSTAKNILLDAQADQIKKKISGYSSAVEMYAQKASEAMSKIPGDVADKIRDGAVAIDEFIGEGNEEVVQAINDYDSWADKVAECKQQLVELQEALRQLELEKFNNIVQDFDTLYDVRQTQIDLIDKSIQLFEASSDKVVSRAFYDESIDQKSKQLDKLMKEKTALTNQMTKAMANGINVASDEWLEMVNAIEAVNGKILESQTAIENYKNAIAQLYLEAFQREAQRYENVISARTKAISGLENQIALLEAQGYVASKKLYQGQISATEKNIDVLERERAALVDRLNEGLANGVKKGSDAWYKMIDAINAVDTQIQQAKISVEQYKKAIADTYTELFNRAAKNNANVQSFRSMAVSGIQKQIEVNESAGELSGRSYYEESIEQTQKRQAQLVAERKELMKKMSDATKNGVKVGSDQWMSMVKSLNDVDMEIKQCTIDVNGFEDAILALDDASFDRIHAKFSSLESELSNLADLFSGEDVATEDNKWTRAGLTQLGIAAQQYELAKESVSQYNKQIEKLNSDYEAGKYSVTQYTEKLAALKSEQWNSVKSAEAAKKSMVELNRTRVNIVIDGINKEVEAYRKLISAEKETLSAEKDLHDYEKSVAEKNESIDKIQRQLASLANDTSLAANAKRAQLQSQLVDAQKDLAELEYQHSIETQQEALDIQLTNYEDARNREIETLQQSLENEELLISESLLRVKENTDIIWQEMITKAQENGIQLSTEITVPWQAGEGALASYEQILTEKTSAFIELLRGVEQKEFDLQVNADIASQKISEMFGNKADGLITETGRAILAFQEEERAANQGSESIGKNFTLNAEMLASEIEKVNGKLREQERASDAAAQKLSYMFGLRADSLIGQIENAWNRTKNLDDAARWAGETLSKMIDGGYTGASAVNALGSIKDAADAVKTAAEGAAQALQSMGSVPTSVGPGTTYDNQEHVTSLHDGSGKVVVWKWNPDGTKQIIGYRAKGSPKIPHDELSWTQENGPEMIISPTTGAVLTPLSKNDMVLPTDQTSNIWEWSKFNPAEFASKLFQTVNNAGGTGQVQTNTMQVGSLITFNAPVNDSAEMIKIAAQQASAKIKQSFRELSNGLTG